MSYEHSESNEFQVLVNAEEQYSIWPDRKPVPAGWWPAGKSGSKVDCLEHIGRVWTDMRPLSLRRSIAAARQRA